MKTVKIRVVVAIDGKGKWIAYGGVYPLAASMKFRSRRWAQKWSQNGHLPSIGSNAPLGFEPRVQSANIPCTAGSRCSYPQLGAISAWQKISNLLYPSPRTRFFPSKVSRLFFFGFF